MARLLSLLIAVTFASSACAMRTIIPPSIPACPAQSPESSATYELREASGARRKETVILVHGLNNKPEVMDELAAALSSFGFDTVRVGLSGHIDEADKHRVSPEIWLGDVKRALCSAAERWPGNKTSLLGYSLGGLLAATVALNDSERPIEHLVLLAPALAMRPGSFPIRVLSRLNGLGISLVSMAPRRYRAFGSTSLDAYRAMFDLQTCMSHLAPSSRAMPSATIFVNPDDEVVSAKGLEEWVARNEMRGWKIVEVRKDAGVSSYNHMLPASDALGPAAWEKLLSGILSALED